MKQQTLDKARLALASGVNAPLLDYFQERRADLLDDLVNCSQESFRQYQGRVLECDEIIKLLKQVR